MTPGEFLSRCPLLWHVGPTGCWERIVRHGMRTAQQLIDAAALDDRTRRELSERPRRSQVELNVDGDSVVLRDQGPLFARKDLTPLLAPGMTVADWIALLNRRVYLFAENKGRDKLSSKYAAQDGSQEIITIDPARLLDVAGERLEVADQNTGAIARVSHPYKDWHTFMPIGQFPDKRPKEITVLDGLATSDALDVVILVERVHAGGRVEEVHRV